MPTASKMWPLVLTRFQLIWSWLSFWPQVTQFRTLPKNHQEHFEQDSWWLLEKNVTARVMIRFSADLARWPSFWPKVTQFWIWPRNHQDKHFEQDSWWLLKQVTPLLPSKFGVNWPLGSGKKRKIDFQDDCHGGHLGILIGTILAIFDLQVIPMLPSKFWVNWLFSSEEAKNRLSRWRPSWISERHDFSYF